MQLYLTQFLVILIGINQLGNFLTKKFILEILNQDPDEGEEDEEEVKIDEKFLPEKKQRDISAEIKRKDHQRELANQINEEARVS